MLVFEQGGFAQTIGQLNISGYLSSLHGALTQDKFRPLHLRYLAYDSLNNNFRLLLDKGDLKNVNTLQIQEATQALLKYFFIGVSLPNSSFWVNLRPNSPDNIIDPYLAQTDIGKILLEADLQLKKDTAKFTSPENPKGKEYWDKLYKKAGELFGYDNVTIPTLTRPWIVPDEIIVREANDNAYIYKATLKVQLEQDHLKDSAVYNFDDPRLKELNEYSSRLIRELIIPELTKEVNISKRYAPLRQVYYSLILSQWFKQKFSNKGGFYSTLIDRRNLKGIASKENWSKTTYFKEYQKSFQKGEYNIQQPIYTPFGQTIRSYFSGGIDFGVAQGLTTAIQKDLVQATTTRDTLMASSYILQVDINKDGISDNLDINRGAIKVIGIESTSSPIFSNSAYMKKTIYDLMRRYVEKQEGKDELQKIIQDILRTDSSSKEIGYLVETIESFVKDETGFSMPDFASKDDTYQYGKAIETISEIGLEELYGKLFEEYIKLIKEMRETRFKQYPNYVDSNIILKRLYVVGNYLKIREDKINRDIAKVLGDNLALYGLPEISVRRGLFSKKTRLSFPTFEIHYRDTDAHSEDPSEWEKENYQRPIENLFSKLRYRFGYKLKTDIIHVSHQSHRYWADDVYEPIIMLPEGLLPKVIIFLQQHYKGLSSILKAAPESTVEQSDRELKRWGIVKLNDLKDSDRVGNKARSFSIFKKLGLRYPDGIAITIPIVHSILTGNKEALEGIADTIMEYFGIDRFGSHLKLKLDRKNRVKLAVRSSPEISMPGILETELDIYNRKTLIEAIRKVALSWQSENASAYRKLNGISDDPNMGIIIQRMVYGNDDNSCSGVVFSRDPTYGRKVSSGTYLYKGNNKDIVSGEASGEPIYKMENKFLNELIILKDALDRLEKEVGFPQEVEFTVDHGTLYFLQTRNMRLDPTIEAAVLKELISIPSTIPEILGYQIRVAGRAIYKIDNRLALPEPRFRASEYISGAMVGVATFSVEKAMELAKDGKGVILIITPETKNFVEAMLSIGKIGIITTFGNFSSHSSVVARGAGIPAAINPKGIKGSQAGFLYFEHWAEPIKVIDEGDEIAINDGKVYNSPQAVDKIKQNLTKVNVVELLPYGIDVLVFRENVRAQHRNVSYEELLDLNTNKYAEFRKYEVIGDQKSAYIVNLEKHFLHELFLEKAIRIGKSEFAAERELFDKIYGEESFPASEKEKESIKATKQTDSNKGSSPLGGIDLRSLPIITQPTNVPGFHIDAGPMNMNKLDNIDLGSEWHEIQNMINAGITPSTQRIKEYVWACCKNGELPKEMNKILSCIADIMRIEEEQVSATDLELKGLLILIESGKSINELELALSNINIPSKEPSSPTKLSQF